MGIWGIPKTRGFQNRTKREEHFLDHGHDFACKNSSRYEALADAFLAGKRNTTTLECRRPQGDILRFDEASNAYGILDSGMIIRSYYKPVPYSTLPAGSARAGTHNRPTNLDYFLEECKRIWVIKS